MGKGGRMWKTHARTPIPLDCLQGDGLNCTFTHKQNDQCMALQLLTCQCLAVINNKDSFLFNKSTAKRLNYEYHTRQTSLQNQVKSGVRSQRVQLGASLNLETFVWVVLSALFPPGRAWVGRRDGRLIKQAGNGLHEKLIRVVMKAKWAGSLLRW